MSKKPKKTKTYSSVNAMLRGIMPRAAADETIDQISTLIADENIALFTELVRLVDGCTSLNTSGVSCPDVRVLRRARKVAEKYGAMFDHAS